jgi:thiamine transporter
LRDADDNYQTKILAEATVFIALSITLYLISRTYFEFLHLPQGGSITLASMVPMLWFSLRRELRWGVEACTFYGLVKILIGGIYYPVQIVLYYPLAFGSLGLAGAFRDRPVLGVAVGLTGRYIFHVISGLIFFQQYAWSGWNSFAYVFAYNATYIVPEFIVSSIIITIITQRKLIDIYL